jgi:hypothetical protein
MSAFIDVSIDGRYDKIQGVWDVKVVHSSSIIFQRTEFVSCSCVHVHVRASVRVFVPKNPPIFAHIFPRQPKFNYRPLAEASP